MDHSRSWLTINGGAVNSDEDGDGVDGLLDDLVAAGRSLALGALVLSFLAWGLFLGALLNVLRRESGCREGEGKEGDDIGELHFGVRRC
jgi:hypothetical protein